MTQHYPLMAYASRSRSDNHPPGTKITPDAAIVGSGIWLPAAEQRELERPGVARYWISMFF